MISYQWSDALMICLLPEYEVLNALQSCSGVIVWVEISLCGLVFESLAETFAVAAAAASGPA